jgi:hypothetical protein
MFYVVSCDGVRIGVLDTDDHTIEQYTTKEIKHFIKDLGITINGIKVDERMNAMHAVDGMQINLFYENSVVIEHFRVIILNAGDRWGTTFKTVINKPTVAFFDVNTTLPEVYYPSGQYIASYYVDTLLGHNPNSSLILNAEVPNWRMSSHGVAQLINLLNRKFK